jgi:hypothetical protein
MARPGGRSSRSSSDAGAEQALAFARNNHWAIASIKDDWKTVFGDEPGA